MLSVVLGVDIILVPSTLMVFQTWAQVLDGQPVSEGDRAAAADYSTRQAAQQALDAAAQESSALAATSQRSKASAVPQPGLPGSPRRGGSISKGRSTSLKHHKSREVGGATTVCQQQRSSVVQSNEVVGASE